MNRLLEDYAIYLTKTTSATTLIRISLFLCIVGVGYS